MIFLRQVIAGKKHVLDNKDLIPYFVPKYDEFAVKNIYEIFKAEPKILEFLSDLKKNRKLPDRRWVMDVVCSLKPHFMKCLIDHADNVRMKEKLPSEAVGEIEISSEYL